MHTAVAKTAVESPAVVLEEIECVECGSATLDGKCLDIECSKAAEQSVPKGSLTPQGLAAPYAFTIRGSVD